MPLVTTDYSRIIGVSACVPSKVIANSDYKWVGLNERRKFIEITGIEKRHVASSKTTTADLCERAANVLIDEMGVDRNKIGFLMFVSQSRDYYLPQTSSILQHKLRLPQSCMASDVALGCSGYIYGLSMMSSLLEKSDSEYGLLLAGDVSTRTTPYSDKSTHPLFGDAGTATIIRKSEDLSKAYYSYGNDGERFDAIIIRNGMFRNGFPPDGFRKRKISKGIVRSKMDLELNGADVFHFSITDVPASIKMLMKQTGFLIDDIDYLILHQANKLIINTIAKIVKFPPEKTPINLDRFGNTSVASIPLCLVSELKNSLQEQKLRLLLTGYGVGLSWGNACIETDKIVVPDIQFMET